MVYSLRRPGDGGTLLARGGPDREGNLYNAAEAGGAPFQMTACLSLRRATDFEEAVMA